MLNFWCNWLKRQVGKMSRRKCALIWRALGKVSTVLELKKKIYIYIWIIYIFHISYLWLIVGYIHTKLYWLPNYLEHYFSNSLCLSVQFSSVAQLCPTLCDPMNHSTPGLPVHHQLPEFTQTHVHQVIDAIQPSHPLSSPSPPAPNPSQHQSLEL